MQPFQIAVVAGFVLGGFAMFYAAWSLAARRRRQQLARDAQGKPGRAKAAEGGAEDPLSWRIERRMDTIETAQADLAERLETLAAEGGEARLQAVAGSLVGLIKDKNATLEVALAGLDQLRARLKALEQMGDLAEARGLFDRLGARLDEIQASQAATEGRLAALRAENPYAEISEQFTRLYAQKDATVETVFARLVPLEARLAEMQHSLAAQDPQAALDRFAARLEEVRTTLQARIDDLETPGENPFAEISEQLTRLYAQKDATVETVFARLAPLEARLAEMEGSLGQLDPQAALDGFAARLEEAWAAQIAAEARLRDRLDALETPGESPFAAISEQLTRLYAQKDATVETVFARLAPLEARLAEMEGSLGQFDPQAALDGFAARLEEARAAQIAAEARLRDRLDALETPGESPFAAISDQLTRLYAQKDATVETVFARLAPLEARLAEMQRDLSARDPQAALDGFAARLEAAQDRLDALEAPGENPFAAISEQLTRLYAQKDATVETVFARLAPLEARLAEMQQDLAAQDPQAALDRFAARLEEVQAAQIAAEARLRDRLDALEAPRENPFAAISDQLTRLYAQKDATVETVFARLAPLEARLAEMQQDLAAQDPQAALDRFAARLEEAQAAQALAEARLRDRLDALEAPGENPFAEISDQLTRLYAQKDATVETVFARLAPLEARLAEMQQDLAAQDPQAALDGFAARLEEARAAQAAAETRLRDRLDALEAPGENPFAAISEQLTRLYAQKDATVETVFARLAPLEARLAEMQQDLAARDPQAALDGFAARLAGVEHLAPRLAALEAGVEAQDPRAALAELGQRLAALQAAQGDVAGRVAALHAGLHESLGDGRPFAAISAQLSQLYAQKDAMVAAVQARLAPLEAKLAALEAREITEDEARAEAQAIATQMIAARAVAAQTELFANRLTLLEASLPRLSLAQALMIQALERQAAPDPVPADPVPAVPVPADPVVGPAEDLWRMPRVVSVHQK